MNILEINQKLLPLLSFLGKILDIIHIAIPIALIVFVTLDLAKAVLSQDNDMVSKTVRSIRNRVIAALAIFFLPTIVEYVFQEVYVSLNMNLEEYNHILESYRAVINSEEIDATDDTKSKEIEEELSYSIDDKSSDEKEKNKINEQNVGQYSKDITKDMFDGNPSKQTKEHITKDFIINYKERSYKLGEVEIDYDDLTLEEVTDNTEYIISTIVVESAKVNNKDQYEQLVINYYFIIDNEEYKLQRINIEDKKSITNYLNKTRQEEKPNEIVAGNKYISNDSNYDYSKFDKLTDKEVKTIYNNNSKNIVMLNTISYSATVNRATGFFISPGVIVTSWSYLQNSFMQGQTIIVSDIDDNTYKINGVVTLDFNSDIVVLKLDKNVNRKAILSNNKLSKNDPVITITSKTGVGLSTITGIVSSTGDDIVSVLPLSKNDWGSPLFNTNGQVVGMNTSKLINSELSNASFVDSLKQLQITLSKTKFKDIKVTSIDEIKKKYYFLVENKEQIKNNIPDKIWKKYKNIGNVEETIILDLVKASYYDDTVSLRYQNNTSDYIDSFSYIFDFVSELEKEGYKKQVSYNEKILYQKGNTKIVIMKEFDYLIIVLAKGSIL